MPLTSLGGGLIMWPPIEWVPTGAANASPAISALTAMTANAWSTYFICYVPFTGTIAYVGFRTATVSGTTTKLNVSIQTVNASGQPSGTNYGSSTASADTTVVSNTAYEWALGTPATATAGALVAVVLTVSSSTAPSIAIACDSHAGSNVPYLGVYNTSTYTNANGGVIVTFGYSDSGGIYKPIMGCLPVIEAYTSTAFNSGSATSRRACKITPQVDMTVCGFWFLGTVALSAQVNMILYDGSNNNLLQVNCASAVGLATNGLKILFSGSTVDLTNGSTYRVSQEAGNANNITAYDITFAGTYAYSNPINNLPGGTNAVLSTYTSGSWTDAPTKRPMCGLLVSRFQQTGGGLLVNPGMEGGTR